MKSALRFVDGALPLDFTAGKSEGCVMLMGDVAVSPRVVCNC